MSVCNKIWIKHRTWTTSKLRLSYRIKGSYSTDVEIVRLGSIMPKKNFTSTGTNTFAALMTNAETNTVEDTDEIRKDRADEECLGDVYTVQVQVPLGCVPIFQRWCSAEFAKYILKGPPTRPVKYPIVKYWQPDEVQFFTFLENKYASKLWNAMTRKANRNCRELYFNFEKRDFDAGFETPAQACYMFLNELTRDDRACACSTTNGKFYGMSFTVWDNASFTTFFSW